MDVFSVALYCIVKKENYNQKGEKFRDFLIRIINNGEISPGKIKLLYDNFYQRYKQK